MGTEVYKLNREGLIDKRIFQQRDFEKFKRDVGDDFLFVMWVMLQKHDMELTLLRTAITEGEGAVK